MLKLPVRTWILSAVAVFSRQHGDVTRQAEQSGCSGETVYQHAQKVERRLAEAPADAAAELRAENQRLHGELAKLQAEAAGRIVLDHGKSVSSPPPRARWA